MKCCHTDRVSVIPNIKVGGFCVGKCNNDAMDGFTVCFEHVTKDALDFKVRQLQSEIKILKKAKRK